MDDSTRRTRDTYDTVGPRFLEKARDRAAILPYLDAFAAALRPKARVLDLGAGPGIDTALLRARGLEAFGLDFSLGMLRTGRPDFPGPRIQGDARHLPLATGSVDGVWANASLLHLQRDDAGRAIAEARRVLRANGVFYLSVKMGAGAATETARYGLPRFFQYWSDTELDAALDAQAFRVVAASAEPGPDNVWLTRIARRA
jgi:SAM-dependent methyltransferase